MKTGFFGTIFVNLRTGDLMKALDKRHIKKLIIILIGCVLYTSASGQFYNGLQMSFGKNKVQYYDFYWQFYRFDDFDCYFNEYGRDLAQFTADYAKKKLVEIEDFFDYTLEKRMIFIIFKGKLTGSSLTLYSAIAMVEIYISIFCSRKYWKYSMAFWCNGSSFFRSRMQKEVSSNTLSISFSS